MAKVEISIELLRKLKENNSYSEKLIVEEFPYLFKILVMPVKLN